MHILLGNLNLKSSRVGLRDLHAVQWTDNLNVALCREKQNNMMKRYRFINSSFLSRSCVKWYLYVYTFNVQLSCSFVRATVTNIFTNIGLLCFPQSQNAFLPLRFDKDVFRWDNLCAIFEPFNLSSGFTQFTLQHNLILLNCCVVLELGSEISFSLCWLGNV